MSNTTCDQLEPLLSAYRDGELSEAEHREAKGHIADCTSCQHRLTELDTVVHALKTLPRLEPQRDYAANIEQLIANAPAPEASSNRRPIIWGGIGVAAAAVVMIAVGNMKPSSNFATLTANSNGAQHSLRDTTQEIAGNEIASLKDSDFVALHGTNDEASHGVNAESISGNGKGSASETTNATEHRGPTAGAAVKESSPANSQSKPVEDENRKKNSKFNPRLQVAQKTNSGSDVVPAVPSQSQGRTEEDGTPLVADNASVKTSMPDSNLVAVYETDQKGVTEELGITTDEDGLYAIKL